MKSVTLNVRSTALGLAMALASNPMFAPSHMDAPLITLDDAANTTDVYAFVTEEDGVEYLTTAVAVYPFEVPGIGPNSPLNANARQPAVPAKRTLFSSLRTQHRSQ